MLVGLLVGFYVAEDLPKVVLGVFFGEECSVKKVCLFFPKISPTSMISIKIVTKSHVQR